MSTPAAPFARYRKCLAWLPLGLQFPGECFCVLTDGLGSRTVGVIGSTKRGGVMARATWAGIASSTSSKWIVLASRVEGGCCHQAVANGDRSRCRTRRRSPGRASLPGEVGSSSSTEGYRQGLGVPLHSHEYVGHRTWKHHRSVWL